MSALQKGICQPRAPDCAFLRAHCRGYCAHGPTATEPDTQRGERPIPAVAVQVSCQPGRARELEPAEPLRSGCCTPGCRGSCATVGHQGGNRWQHLVLPWGWARWQLGTTRCLRDLPGWPPRAGCRAGGHTAGITRVMAGAFATWRQSSCVKHTRGCEGVSDQVCPWRTCTVLSPQCVLSHPSSSSSPRLSSLSSPTCHLNRHKCLCIGTLLSYDC